MFRIFRETFQRFPWLIRLAIIVAIILFADRLLWPRYSGERHIDPDDVVAIVLPYQLREVQSETDLRLVKRVVGAVNGARRWMGFGIKWDQEMILHFRRGPSLAIDHGELKRGSEMYFWGQSRNNRFGELRFYRAGGLRKVLDDIRASERCRMKTPRIPPQSLRTVVCYAAGSQKTLPGSDTHARRVLGAVNEFLSLTNACYCEDPGDGPFHLFYEGQAQPESYLKSTTGAVLALDPPLAMHTTLLLSSYPTVAEYHRFKTRRLFLSDSISLHGLRVVGFSSDEKPNRFYLFFGERPVRIPDRELATKRWQKILAAIEDAMREIPTATPTLKGPSPAPRSGQTPFRPS